MSKPILYTGILCLIVGIELAITKAAPQSAYVACNWLDSTVIDEQGNLNVDLVDQILPPSKKPQLSNLIIRCHKAQPKNQSAEDIIYGMAKCIYPEDSSLVI
ncbi:uncharacterized protein LOC114332997 isoform X2 [Diabrotica virgifera virgifera]|uniref:Uncharacterized protein LOC114332997 isoform X3 n=1 Tax=Diabrotica virgifera virgifera TaxID=50390 RepID=A0A6P7G1T8_DIAVI|nr:uncharacterized protein LOC114332997 isoform X2 [Diabrotica virgifera virgifera]